MSWSNLLSFLPLSFSLSLPLPLPLLLYSAFFLLSIDYSCPLTYPFHLLFLIILQFFSSTYLKSSYSCMHSRALATHSHNLIFTLLSFLRPIGCRIFRKPAENQTCHKHWPITSQQLPFLYIGDKSSLWEDTETSTVTQQGPCLFVDLSWIKQYRVRQKKKLVIYSAFWLFNLGQKSWDHLQ